PRLIIGMSAAIRDLDIGDRLPDNSLRWSSECSMYPRDRHRSRTGRHSPRGAAAAPADSFRVDPFRLLLLYSQQLSPDQEKRSMDFLVVTTADGRTFRRDLDVPRILVGRSSRNDLVLPDLSLSRVHAEIYREGESFLVKDAGSKNGTLLND